MLHEQDIVQAMNHEAMDHEAIRRRRVVANKLRYRKRTPAERNRLRPVKGGIHQRRIRRLN
jgi:hypothetical protein